MGKRSRRWLPGFYGQGELVNEAREPGLLQGSTLWLGSSMLPHTREGVHLGVTQQEGKAGWVQFPPRNLQPLHRFLVRGQEAAWDTWSLTLAGHSCCVW